MNIITSLNSGKIYKNLTDGLKTGKPSCLIVPEQFLFETERNMYRELGGKGISRVNITGFSKLAAEITAKFGEAKLYADDIIKQAEMYKTIAGLKNSLVYYKGSVTKAAFKMLSVVADFKAAGITPATLEKAAFSDGSALSLKMSDITRIYGAYQKNLETDYADKLDDLGKAAKLITEHDYFSGCDVYIYEFDGFSKSQLDFISALDKTADNLSVYIRSDREVSENRDFFAMNRLISRLKNLAERYDYTNLGGEANTPVTQTYVADDVYGECEFVAAKIRELITKDGYTCNDIAVLVCGEGTAPVLKDALYEYEISAFIDLPEPVIKKPLTRFILSALDAVGLDSEKLLLFIKSGFVRIGSENTRKTKRLSARIIDSIEKYAHKWNIKKREWGEKFPESNKDLNSIEKYREKITGVLKKLEKATKNTAGDKITEALFEFLADSMTLQRSVMGLCRLRRSVNPDDYRQLWDLIVGVFESLHSSFAGYPMTAAEYAELLREIFCSLNIAKPPQVIDAVTVGDPERSRVNGAKVVFITGANLGAFPRNITVSGELSGKEIETLCENKIEVKAGRDERYASSRFIKNKALTLPSDRLYISAPLKDASWAEQRLSPVFDGYEIMRREDFPLSFWASTIRSARRLLAENRKNAALKAALIKAGDGEFAGAVTGEGSGFLHELSPNTAEKIFDFSTVSPSRFEDLVKCRFRYFCKYGLRLGNPPAMNEDLPSPIQRGYIIHYCLERILRSGNTELTDKELELCVDGYIKEYRDSLLPSGYAQSKRQFYILKSYKSGIIRMLRHILDDLNPKNSAFKPASFEKRVNFPFAGTVISGIIDRLDLLSDGKNKYARVIDYKSGSKEMNFPAVYYGLDMQMLLYLFAVCKESGALPSAALYMPADGAKMPPDLFTGLNADSKTARKTWLSAHKPSGVIIADGSMAEADYAAQEARYIAESGARANKKFFDTEKLTIKGYNALERHCESVVGENIAAVKGGNINAVPLFTGGLTEVCDFCDYASACFNRKGEFRETDKEAIYRIMNNE